MSREKKLFLLDAMALIYRAHFAFIRNPRYNSKGLNTSAILGFTNSLLEVLEKEKPSHIAVISDSDKPTFRHEEYADYKGTREEMPEAIQEARPYIEKIIQAFGIPYIIRDGYEADDVIGTLAKKAATKGFKVYMVTSDKDFCQLVEDGIYLYKPGTGQKRTEIQDRDKVLKKWEITSTDQVRDILGLMGDASDNIPGVPGIGEKRAKDLIKEYKTIENLLENKDQLKGKILQNLTDYAEQAIASKKLVTIDTDAPVELEVNELKYTGPDLNQLKEIFNDLEFRTLGKRVLGQNFEISGQAEDEGASKPATIESIPKDYRFLKTPEELKKFIDEISGEKLIGLDTETNGLDPHQCKMIGLSLAGPDHKAAYIPFNAEDSEPEKLFNELRPLLENPEIEKAGHNLKYDLIILQHAGLDVKGLIFDTMVAHFLLDPDSRHNLNLLAEKYLNYTPVSIESLIGKKGKGQENMENLKPEEISDYACEDADVAFRLAQLFKDSVKKEELDNLYDKVEGPLIKVLAEVEKNGIFLDENELKGLSDELNKEMEKLEQEIYDMAGKEFNINSPKQLGDIMFDEMQLDPEVKRLPKSGQYPTNEEKLKKLEKDFDFPSKILDYRSIHKLKSTYVDALPKLVNPQTGRIHTSLNQTVTATGRLSSTNPNLQNIPIRTEKGREIRKAFAAPDNDHWIYCADYSQIELRLMAEFSGDEALLEAFINHQDIHTATAAKVFDIDPEEVTGEMRRSAKTVNFGIIYGISAFGLSERMNIPRKEAASIIETYFKKYPGVREYMDREIEFARKHGYVKTLLGKKRHLPDINSRNFTTRGYAERNAINTPIQGTAAEMIKIAMINIQEELQKQNYKAKMVLQVHDELIFETPKDELETLTGMVEQKMKTAIKLEVPIIVEGGKGKNWLEAH